MSACGATPSCDAVLQELLADRDFAFPVERAVFLTVLHRLMVSGSDRACDQWRDDYRIDGVDAPAPASPLPRHGLARRGTAATGRPTGRWWPRCIKDLVEERLFARRRDAVRRTLGRVHGHHLAVFRGRGGATLGERGYLQGFPAAPEPDDRSASSSTARPADRSEMWPGNTADVTTLLPVIDRLRGRFAIGRVCVVADRGMISAATIAGLEEQAGSNTSSAYASAAPRRCASDRWPTRRRACRW